MVLISAIPAAAAAPVRNREGTVQNTGSAAKMEQAVTVDYGDRESWRVHEERDGNTDGAHESGGVRCARSAHLGAWRRVTRRIEQ